MSTVLIILTAIYCVVMTIISVFSINSNHYLEQDYVNMRNLKDDFISLLELSEERVYNLNHRIEDLLLEIQEKDAIIKELEDEIDAN
jgi:hypothetical protein